MRHVLHHLQLQAPDDEWHPHRTLAQLKRTARSAPSLEPVAPFPQFWWYADTLSAIPKLAPLGDLTASKFDTSSVR